MPEAGLFEVDIIDTWEMTVTTPARMFQGKFTLELPGKPGIAVLIRSAV